jgi:hypothetical protein
VFRREGHGGGCGGSIRLTFASEGGGGRDGGGEVIVGHFARVCEQRRWR